jgi:hypothetical protein
MRHGIVGLVARLAVGFAVGMALLSVGCEGSSQQTGELGKAQFSATNCGGALSDLGGCDLKKKVAVGGLIDVQAVRLQGSGALQLRAEPADVLKLELIAGTRYTISGQSNGKAVLTAFDGSGDVDRLTVTVEAIALIAYNTVSNGFGDFKLQPGGDINGFFTLGQGVTNFTFLFLQVDGDNQSMLGRDSFAYELSPGLVFQAGKESPHGLQFDLVRPAMPGNYTLTVRAKYGGGRFKMQVTAN